MVEAGCVAWDRCGISARMGHDGSEELACITAGGFLMTCRYARRARPRFTCRAAHLDTEYTVFGKVLSGEDVLAKLETARPL